MSVTDEDLARFERLRAHGQRIHTAIQDLAAEVGLKTPLDRLAFVVGTSREVDPETGLLPPFNWRMHDAKVAARDSGASWRDLAIAMGEGDDDRAMERVRARFNDNQARLDEQREAAS